MREQTNKDRERALPPIGQQFQLGPYLWQVTYINVGKLRFTAEMVGLIQDRSADEEVKNNDKEKKDDL